MIVPMLFGTLKGYKAFPFFVLVVFLSKNLNYVVKDVSILQIKPSNSSGPI
jgi:hypothetical protein